MYEKSEPVENTLIINLSCDFILAQVKNAQLLGINVLPIYVFMEPFVQVLEDNSHVTV